MNILEQLYHELNYFLKKNDSSKKEISDNKYLINEFKKGVITEEIIQHIITNIDPFMIRLFLSDRLKLLKQIIPELSTLTDSKKQSRKIVSVHSSSNNSKHKRSMKKKKKKKQRNKQRARRRHGHKHKQHGGEIFTASYGIAAGGLLLGMLWLMKPENYCRFFPDRDICNKGDEPINEDSINSDFSEVCKDPSDHISNLPWVQRQSINALCWNLDEKKTISSEEQEIINHNVTIFNDYNKTHT